MPARAELLLLGLVLLAGCAAPPRSASSAATLQPGLVTSEFIFEQAPFPSCHASTIAQTPSGLVAAWFGGTAERNPDVGIWVSRLTQGTWSAPVEVANGVQPDGKRHPCWNPVLFQPTNGPLLLFYKVGSSPASWWGMLMTSSDDGKTWSKPQRLPDGQVGPVRNKPVPWPDGSLFCGSSTEYAGWRIHMERTPDLGRTWERTQALNDPRDCGLIQPTILRWPSGKTQILCRSRQARIYESWMGDHWKQWSTPRATPLPNPSSAIDAVILQDGRALLVYNHSERGRTPLNIAVSRDGKQWQAALALETEPGGYSYPAVIQTADGLVHITYTWKRLRIKHVVVDPARLQPQEIVDGRWPEPGR